jgi:cell wall assembly regulator SMI1
MDDLWDRVERVLGRHAPSVANALRPPATREQIAAAEQVIGVVLPHEIRFAYLRHDGCEPGPELFPPMNWWCSLEEMVQKWQQSFRVAADLKARGEYNIVTPEQYPWDDMTVRPEWWCDHWIPIGVTDTATSVHVDLLPAPKGIKGQLLIDNGMTEARVLAPSLTNYLTTMADRYEKGLIIYDHGLKTASGASITYWDDLDRNVW